MIDCWSSLVVFACSPFGASWLLIGSATLIVALYFMPKIIPESIRSNLAVIKDDIDPLTGIFFVVVFLIAVVFSAVLILLGPIPVFGALVYHLYLKREEMKARKTAQSTV